MGAQSSGSFLFSEWETQSQPTGQSAVSFILFYFFKYVIAGFWYT